MQTRVHAIELGRAIIQLLAQNLSETIDHVDTGGGLVGTAEKL